MRQLWASQSPNFSHRMAVKMKWDSPIYTFLIFSEKSLVRDAINQRGLFQFYKVTAILLFKQIQESVGFTSSD